MNIREQVIQSFRQEFKADPRFLTHSPGRVNLIGEHTDYNDGFVLPLAINFSTWIALRPRQDQRVAVTALDKNERLEFDLDDFSRGAGGWREYITGVAWALQDAGHKLTGWEGVFSGDVPQGAGLSSSASLELALARAFSLVSNLKWDPALMSRLCQKAENQWVGINSGIMDQMVSASGKENFALLIDCRSLEIQQVPLPDNTSFVILDSSLRRDLVNSAYNERREECEAVACHFDVNALRDITLDQLEAKVGQLNMMLYRRARHVITENLRVLDAVEALKRGDAPALGKLMVESHQSMRDDFEISREEMDQLVQTAQELPGCYGVRMTGGGFGGCAIALVADDGMDAFLEAVVRKYRERTRLQPKAYLTSSADGTGFEDLRS